MYFLMELMVLKNKKYINKYISHELQTGELHPTSIDPEELMNLMTME